MAINASLTPKKPLPSHFSGWLGIMDGVTGEIEMS